jgi:hypothetical protein
MPVTKSAISKTSAKIQMVVSFMALPPAFYDLEEKNETFDETADPDTVGYRVKWQLDGRGRFPRDPIFIADAEEAVSDEDKENDAQDPGKDVHERPVSLGKSVHKIHVNVLLMQGDLRNGEPDDQCQHKADNFIRAHNGAPSRPHDNIRDGQEHHQRQCGSRDNGQPLARFLKKVKHAIHMLPP